MKKYITVPILFAAAIAMSSCMKEELQPEATSGNGRTIVFEGDFAVSTKIQFNDAEDGIHTLTWSEGDAIGIFSYDQTETQNNNIQATLHSSTVGVSKGIFIPQDEIITIPPTEEGGEPTEGIISIEFPEASDEQFAIYYPYKKGTALNVDDGSLHSTVAPVQEQDRVGDRKVLANGFATAVANVKAGSEKATFALEHKLAYISIKATSSEFTGYQLHGVQLFDKNGSAHLTGEFAINPVNGNFSLVGEGGSSVRVNVKNHDFSAAPEKNELYLAVLPGDYSSADMYVVVTFINADGATKTVPMKFDKKCNFPAGSLTTIDLGDITSEDNAFPWYEISEDRDLLGLWAYGSQNTYMAMRPETEGNSTQVVIDVKARGDFSQLKEPKYYSLLVPSDMGDPSVNWTAGIRWFLSLDGTTEQNALSGAINPVYSNVSSDYTISVYVLDQTVGTGRWGTVAIYDENHELLWSYMVIGYKEGDEPKDVQYPGFAMMDRFLGQANGNKLSAEKGDFDIGIAFFQWGRKDPFPWTNTNGLAMYTIQAEQFETVGECTKNPTLRIGANDKWYAGDVRWDLWGGFNNTTDWYDPACGGAKTVYDPCPEGYRIPDGKVFKEVGDNTEIWEVAGAHNTQVTDPDSPNYHIKPDSPFTAKKFSVLAYEVAPGEYDYWPFLGYIANKGNNYTDGRASSITNRYMYAWGNSSTYASMSTNNYRGLSFEYSYWSSGPSFNTRHDMFMCYGFPVRCQKDDLGR